MSQLRTLSAHNKKIIRNCRKFVGNYNTLLQTVDEAANNICYIVRKNWHLLARIICYVSDITILHQFIRTSVKAHGATKENKM